MGLSAAGRVAASWGLRKNCRHGHHRTARDLYEVKDGFFGKGPLDRIKVAFMGPFVNIVFALLAFTALWLIGGRRKNFSDHTTSLAGWIQSLALRQRDSSWR